MADRKPLPDPWGDVATIRVQDHDGRWRIYDNTRHDMVVGLITWADALGNPPEDGVQEYEPGYDGPFSWENLHAGPLTTADEDPYSWAHTVDAAND